jgi:simple sugar transport system ATP-binding protein
MKSLPLKKGAAQLRKAGLRYVPSDKIRRGSSLTSTMAENLLLLDSRRLARRGWLNPGRVREWTAARSKAGGISGRPEQRLDELSGGNIQKVILQRELSRSGPLLVAADPTWGLDEKSRLQVQRQIRQIRDRGTAVLLLASDLDEALELSDRLAVLSGGRLSAFRPPEKWDRGEAARLIAGGGR